MHCRISTFKCKKIDPLYTTNINGFILNNLRIKDTLITDIILLIANFEQA